jgi:AcrR family transcriptional regulator
MAMVDNPTKRTQEEKSRNMRQRLITATLACLQQLGYHGTSISQILDRAGVSRGAWRHHYSSKRELVAAAAEFFLTGPIEKVAELAPLLNASGQPLETLVEFVWQHFYQGNYRDIWLEINVACRTDQELKARIAPVIRDFFSALDRLWRENFYAPGEVGLPIEDLMNLTLYTMRGMAIQSVSIDEPGHYQKMRQVWIKILSPLVEVREGAFGQAAVALAPVQE